MRGDVTGLVLAGGLARRMSGIDKALATLRGRPLIEHVIARLAPQVGEVLINANRNLERYRALGCRVVSDEIDGYAGPLAGLHAGMRAARSELIATVPCDSPFLPADLVERLAAARETLRADLAVAKTGAQPHPVFALCAVSLSAHLGAFLDAGGRKIDRWYASLAVAEVDFEDQAAAFSNINTPDELRAFETAT